MTRVTYCDLFTYVIDHLNVFGFYDTTTLSGFNLCATSIGSGKQIHCKININLFIRLNFNDHKFWAKTVKIAAIFKIVQLYNKIFSRQTKRIVMMSKKAATKIVKCMAQVPVSQRGLRPGESLVRTKSGT